MSGQWPGKRESHFREYYHHTNSTRGSCFVEGIIRLADHRFRRLAYAVIIVFPLWWCNWMIQLCYCYFFDYYWYIFCLFSLYVVIIIVIMIDGCVLIWLFVWVNVHVCMLWLLSCVRMTPYVFVVFIFFRSGIFYFLSLFSSSFLSSEWGWAQRREKTIYFQYHFANSALLAA